LKNTNGDSDATEYDTTSPQYTLCLMFSLNVTTFLGLLHIRLGAKHLLWAWAVFHQVFKNNLNNDSKSLKEDHTA